MRPVTGWKVCMDYWKLNVGTEKDHFPMPFMDQMLDRLTIKGWYCFLDGYSSYNQISIAHRIKIRPLYLPLWDVRLQKDDIWVM
uniref:Reverse transcriptase domain-containing protein n=1 Tax=Solanum lycopersicum TaxID=4081 RepID=A0A3Q7EW03_SOLLC